MEKQKKDELQLRTKAFVMDLLAGVNIEDGIRNIISYIMKEVGNFTHADMVCIYESGTEQDCVNKVYQWKASNPIVEDAKVQPLQNRELDAWIDRLKSKKLVVIEDRESVRKHMSSEYERMERQGIHSLLIIPLYTKDRLPACMSLMNPDFSTFAVLESALLYLGQEIGLFYHRERINHKYMLFMDGIRSGNLSEFIVDYKTRRYEAYRITKVLNGKIPEEGEWEWIRQFYASIIKPEYREEFLRRTEQEYMETFLPTEQSSFAIDLEREVNGNNTWFRLEFSVVSLDEQGHLERFVVLVKDITQMKKEEEEHQQMIKALSSFYKASFMIDVVNRMVQPIKHVAKQFRPEEKLPHEVVLDTFCNRMVEEEYVENVREFMNLDTLEQRLQGMNMISFEYRGNPIEWGRMILAPAQWNQDGRLEKVVFAVEDITEQKRREEWMQYKIEHDELTGTLSRTAFNRVTRLLEESDIPFALVLLDIDKFKVINDTYGHDIGDDVLIGLVSVLNEKMRSIDKIFRLGGDEFAVIMSRLTLVQVECVKSIVESVNKIITSGVDGLPAFSISAGVTFSEHGYNETVYHNADKALYRTKETTRRGCTVFEEMGDIG